MTALTIATARSAATRPQIDHKKWLDQFDADRKFGSMTIHDAILTQVKPKTYNEYNSLRTGFMSRLKPGGSHSHMFGTKLFYSKSKRKNPQWVEDKNTMNDTVVLSKDHWFSSPEVNDVISRINILIGRYQSIDPLVVARLEGVIENAQMLAKSSARQYYSNLPAWQDMILVLELALIEQDTLTEERDQAYLKNDLLSEKINSLEARMSLLENQTRRKAA